ncbi:MAG: DUF4428 domain-containing protein [Bacillota bacterium]|jgi:hypothetical protein|nr:DUF4428 domain-containing protein [Bacillota bacterium]
MGLKSFFKSKDCDICGEKIKLLGNRKLEDGNICNKCAKKLSPFFSERRKSTLAEIRDQLQYRADNEQQLLSFTPTRIFGNNTKIMIDENSRKFIVTNRNKWQEHNPDLISLDQVTYCNVNVDEDREEIYRKDSSGKRVSYEPRRYQYKYSFWIEIGIQSPWFDLIRFELSTTRPENRHDRFYRDYERQGEEIRAYMNSRGNMHGQSVSFDQQAYSSPTMAAPTGTPVGTPAGSQTNTSEPGGANINQPKFCPNCGNDLSTRQPAKFCPNCGGQLG